MGILERSVIVKEDPPRHDDRCKVYRYATEYTKNIFGKVLSRRNYHIYICGKEKDDERII